MEDNIFEKGLKLDVTKHIEKKGKFSYLSWAWAVQELRKLDPKSTWEVIHFSIGPNGCDPTPYMKTDSGYFVEVVVTMSNGVKSQQIHPVLNNYNKPIENPTSFEINTSIQRCLTKAIALASGIGLHLYAGEDLPPSDIEPVKRDWIKEIESAKDENKLRGIFAEAYSTTDGEEKAKVKMAYDKKKQEFKGEEK